MLVAAVIYAKEMDVLKAFYQNLDFAEVAGDGETFATLAKDQSELTIVQAPVNIAEEIELAGPVLSRVYTPLKLVFLVASIEESAQLLNAAGGRIDRGQARWEMGEFFVQDAVDPEGNIFQLRERK